jgi:glycine/D-amino acid oxidase-like deaminating enzyme
MTDIAVIGAGLLGSAVAYYASLAGASVTLIEQGRPGGGTSSTTFSWLNANNKTPREYFDLNLAGMREHVALEQQLGEAPWLHHGGNLEWADDDRQAAELEAKVERLLSWGYRAEWLSADRVLRDLEPCLDLNLAGANRITYFPDECWLDPLPLIQRLLHESVKRGARLRRGTIAGLQIEDGRVRGITTSGGERIGADVTVCCAGRWTASLASSSGFTLPTANTAGLLALTMPSATGLRHILHAPRVNIRPDGAGRLLLASDQTDANVTPETHPSPDLPGCRELLERACEVLPSLRGTPIEAARLGIRPIPADGVTTAGAIPGVDNAYMLVTHSGATMCLALGRMAAGEILEGRSAPELAAFRPARFVSNAAG